MLRNTLFLTTAWTLLFAANQTANAQKEKIEFLAGDTADFAAENAPQIAAMMRPLLKVYNLEQPNIVVLPFSNEDGDVTLDTAETLVSLQGELISALKKEKLGVVLDLKDIKRSFSRSKVNPADINPVTKKAATAAMNKMEWHCCVTGSFDIKDTGDAKLNFSKRKALKLALNLIYAAADAGANNSNSNNNNANNNNGGNNNGGAAVFSTEGLIELADKLTTHEGTTIPGAININTAPAIVLEALPDVTEEIDRLGAHIDAARGLMQEKGAVGRKVDFLMQEFNREANTLCSKSQSVALTGIGLDLKALIDQMREQVQNIE